MLAANEFLVRASGSFDGPSRTVPPDSPVPGEGHFSFAQLWDCGPALEHDALEERRAVEPEPKKKEGKGTIVALGVGLGAFIMYKLIGGRQEEARENQRMEDVELRAKRAKRLQRIQSLLHEGHERRDAEALAETEEWDHEAERTHHQHAAEEA